MGYESEDALERLRKGSISEYEARDIIERDYGSCSCMWGSIEETIRDSQYFGRDGFDGDRRLQDDQARCRRRELEDERENERERERY